MTSKRHFNANHFAESLGLVPNFLMFASYPATNLVVSNQDTSHKTGREDKRIGQERNNRSPLMPPPARLRPGGIVIQGLSNRFDSFYLSSENIELGAVLLQLVERISPRENRYRQ